MRSILRKIIILCFALLTICNVMAQVTTSALKGTISDAEGPLPGAYVEATYLPTGVVFRVLTDVDGSYHLQNLIPGGPYEILVHSIGLQTQRIVDVSLALADTKVLNVTMKDERVDLEEVVIVGHGLDNMSSDRAGSITTIDSHVINRLPSTNRTLNDALILTPQGLSTSEGFAVGGGNYRQSSVTVDGAIFNNSFGIGQNMPASGNPISLEVIDQLSISITPYDVRQTGFVGGAILATTKSGTNKWHASAYDYFRSSDLQGKKMGRRNNMGEYPEDLKLTQMLHNTIGFSVGGPIVKNKLFFFFNAEYDVDNTPGQSRRTSSDGVAHGQFNRPTTTQMNNISQYLQDTYGYNPGRFEGYSFNTPDWRLFGRLDWNINPVNRLSLRYSYTSQNTMNYPSSSVAPFGNNDLYNRYLNGRASPYAMYFESTCYNQEENFSSLAAEWNARLFEGRATNTLRATWSHQHEPRSYRGDLFPTVDILMPLSDGTRAVFTTFGVDPFTYGNIRNVHSVSIVDEFTHSVGRHTIMSGVSFDYAKAENGFMQMGAGYYLYNSWEDFVNDAKPLAFAITHANRDDLRQQYPSMANMNVGVYLQDEVKVNPQLNLIYGLRMDLPIYPKLECENKAFTEIFAETTGWKTSDVPKTYLSVAPRIGFNWDILGNRRLVMRGGTGYFVGKIPMVWLVSAVSNSNTLQNQVVMYDPNGLDMHFHTNVNDILEELYGGTFHQQELGTPYNPTILAKNLRMPGTWKTSLALNYTSPSNVRLSLEAIFNRDINPIVVSKGGLVCQENGLVLTEGIDVRNLYKDAGLGTHPYIIHNSSKSGYYASLTAKLEKSFYCGITLSAAYTFANAKTISDGLGDQVSSAFSFNTYSVNGSNELELGNSSFVSPHRLLMNFSYEIEEGEHSATTISLFYDGSNIGSVLENTYTRWTPTMNSNLTGEGGSNNVIYIPTEDELSRMTFVSESNKADFNQFIIEHRELRRHRGEYAERGCMLMPWRSLLNFRLKQNFHIEDKGGREHNVELGWDVRNLLNLFCREWGNFYCVDNTDILKWENGVYTFDPVGGGGVETLSSSTASTWSMMFSLKYFF